MVPEATLAAGAILLYPVAVTCYDAVVILSLAAAPLCTSRRGRYLALSYASLGLGAAAKLLPTLATLPLAFSGRGAARGYAIFFGILAFFLPALLLGGNGFLESFAYQADGICKWRASRPLPS
jgi:uncharacterized membrane protein